MPRRIDIELTSSREDGSWTWRAAGAREPRGTVGGSLLPSDTKVGDVLKVDAEFFVDGIEITGVVPVKGPRTEPERIELLVPAEEAPLVTTSITGRPRDDRGPRRDGPRRDRPPRREGDARRDGEGRPRDRGDRKDRPERGERSERRDRPPRRNRPTPPPMPAVERPKAKRLRPGKAHRIALLESLPEEQRPIAEQVVLGGLPAVRQAIEKQNAERTASGEPPISAGPLLEIAERLVPKVRTAEWRDRAEAAQRDLDVLDLRDLRSVVSAADAAAKDDETRALATALRDGLASRAEAEHQAWLAELTATVDVGRIVRALRLSSRPPKAGTPLPPELATRLTEGASAALTDDAPSERWVAVLDALAFSPVRDKVIPASLPKELDTDVRATIARLATRIPKIAHIFEVAPDRNAPRPKVERRKPKRPPKPKLESEPKTDEAAKDEARRAGTAEPDESSPSPQPEPGEAAGGAGVSPADQAEGGSADPEPAPREPEASTPPKPEEDAEGDRRGDEEGSADPEPAPREPEAGTPPEPEEDAEGDRRGSEPEASA
jgi:hypothetical protein